MRNYYPCRYSRRFVPPSNVGRENRNGGCDRFSVRVVNDNGNASTLNDTSYCDESNLLALCRLLLANHCLPRINMMMVSSKKNCKLSAVNCVLRLNNNRESLLESTFLKLLWRHSLRRGCSLYTYLKQKWNARFSFKLALRDRLPRVCRLLIKRRRNQAPPCPYQSDLPVRAAKEFPIAAVPLLRRKNGVIQSRTRAIRTRRDEPNRVMCSQKCKKSRFLENFFVKIR